jgi:hypothetical protein
MKTNLSKAMIATAVLFFAQFAKADYTIIERSVAAQPGQISINVWFPINSANMSPASSDLLIRNAKEMALKKACGADYRIGDVRVYDIKNISSRYDLSSTGLLRIHYMTLVCKYGLDYVSSPLFQVAN